jgi:AcrR family transcriptional regulator
MPGKPDRRVQRTKQLLRGALLSLIQEKGYEALSVQDIIDRANVGRATFYAHFDNKEDLLVSGFDDLRASLKQRQREALARGSGVEERVLAFAHELFAHTREHRDVFRAMVGRQSGALVEQILHRIVVDLVRDDVKALAARRDEASMPAEAVVQFVAGGLFGVLMWWLEGKKRLSVEEVDTAFRRLAIPAMKSAAV